MGNHHFLRAIESLGDPVSRELLQEAPDPVAAEPSTSKPFDADQVMVPLVISVTGFALNEENGLMILESPGIQDSRVRLACRAGISVEVPVSAELSVGTRDQHLARISGQIGEIIRQLFGAVEGGALRRSQTEAALQASIPQLTPDLKEAAVLPALSSAPPVPATPNTPATLTLVGTDNPGTGPDELIEDRPPANVSLVEHLLTCLPGLKKYRTEEREPGVRDPQFNPATASLLELSSAVGLLKVARHVMDRFPEKPESDVWYSTELINDHTLYIRKSERRRSLFGVKLHYSHLARFMPSVKAWTPIGSSDAVREELVAIVGESNVVSSSWTS